jgi:hypothetical protein
LMTPVPYPIAYALIGGLSADSVVKHPQALTVFPEVTLIDFNFAAQDALKKTNPAQIERVWLQGSDQVGLSSEVHKSLKHEGCFIDYRETQVNAKLTTVSELIQKLTGRIPNSTKEQQSEAASFLFERNLAAGQEWMELHITTAPDMNASSLSQTVFFRPKGLPGFLYGFLLFPIYRIKFQRLIKTIRSSS